MSSNRLDHCEIDIGILLNIGTDHYEEHGGKLLISNAKKRLVQMVKTMIVNKDDKQCVEDGQQCNRSTRLFWDEFVGGCPSARTENES